MTYLITSEHIHLYLSEDNADMVYRVRAITCTTVPFFSFAFLRMLIL